MLSPVDHGMDFNTHRLCLNDDTGDLPFDLQVNHGDLFWLSRVLDGIRRDAKQVYAAEHGRRKGEPRVANEISVLIKEHERLADEEARHATGADGEVPHDGYFYCHCETAQKIRAAMKAEAESEEG